MLSCRPRPGAAGKGEGVDGDEEQIRQLVQQWHAASKAGDTATVLSLMADDAVFLVPGRAPIDRREFAALSTPAPGAPRPSMDIEQTIHEIEVGAGLACMRSTLTVRIVPPESDAIVRSGPTLTVFRKVGGRWLLARDANLLAPQA